MGGCKWLIYLTFPQEDAIKPKSAYGSSCVPHTRYILCGLRYREPFLLSPCMRGCGKDHAMLWHHNLSRHCRLTWKAPAWRPIQGPLFRTIGRWTGQLTRTSLPQANAHVMIRRRHCISEERRHAEESRFHGQPCQHSHDAAHDRCRDEMSLYEIERVVI